MTFFMVVSFRVVDLSAARDTAAARSIPGKNAVPDGNNSAEQGSLQDVSDPCAFTVGSPRALGVRARSYRSGWYGDETPSRGRSGVRSSPSWPRWRTGRSPPSAALRSRRRWRRPPSSPTGSPSRSGRSRFARAPGTGRGARRRCGRASTRSDPRARPQSRGASFSAGAAGGRGGGGDRRRRLRLGLHGRALPRAPSRPPRSARRPRRRDAHEDVLGLADRARRRPGCRASTTGASTRPGCGTPPACSSRSGRSTKAANVTLWAGVSPADFTTLTVTREQADGNQASSGEKVLVGTVDERLTRSRRRAGARPAGGRGRGGSSRSPRGSAGPGPSPCRRGR